MGSCRAQETEMRDVVFFGKKYQPGHYINEENMVLMLRFVHLELIVGSGSHLKERRVLTQRVCLCVADLTQGLQGLGAE